MLRLRGILIISAMLGSVALSGCSLWSEFTSEAGFTSEELEQAIVEWHTEELGEAGASASVECDEFEFAAGATVRCTRTEHNGSTIGMTVTFSTPDGVPSWQAQDDETYETVGSGFLEPQILAGIQRESGLTPERVECPDGTPAQVGTTARCTVVYAGGAEYGVTVTIDEVQGATVHFTFVVDDTPTA